MPPKYPSQSEIRSLFSKLSTVNRDAFFARVSSQVNWTVMGTHHCAGRYNSLADVHAKVINRLNKAMKPPGIAFAVRNVIGGGENEPWCTVELVARGNGINGFTFENCYAWCCRFDEAGMIVEVRAYLDSSMVRDCLDLLDPNGEKYEASKRAHIPAFDDL